MNKKAGTQMSIEFTIFLILAVTSFIVVIGFIAMLDWGDEKQVCHSSVVWKSALSGWAGDLNCHTTYVCISGGGECAGFSPTKTVYVDLNDKYAFSKILKAMADEAADCRWMFGDENDISERALYKDFCALCSQIAFDDTIQNLPQLKTIPYMAYYKFLEMAPYKDETYLSYIYGVSSLEDFANANSGVKADYFEKSFFTNKTYYAEAGATSKFYFLNEKHKVTYFASDELDKECKYVTKA